MFFGIHESSISRLKIKSLKTIVIIYLTATGSPPFNFECSTPPTVRPADSTRGVVLFHFFFVFYTFFVELCCPKSIGTALTEVLNDSMAFLIIRNYVSLKNEIYRKWFSLNHSILQKSKRKLICMSLILFNYQNQLLGWFFCEY